LKTAAAGPQRNSAEVTGTEQKHKGPSGLLLGLPLSGKAATLDFLKGTGRSVFDRCEDGRQLFLEHVPVDGRQHHYCNAPPGKVLLVRNDLVAGNENFEAVVLGCFQKLAVLQPRPALIPNRENIVIAEVVPQQMRKIFIEQHFHGTGCFTGPAVRVEHEQIQ